MLDHENKSGEAGGGSGRLIFTGCDPDQQEEEKTMAWSKSQIREIECGMEINMYGPSEDEGGVVLF